MNSPKSKSKKPRLVSEHLAIDLAKSISFQTKEIVEHWLARQIHLAGKMFVIHTSHKEFSNGNQELSTPT